MNGFERELNQRVLSVVPHAELYSYNGNENVPIQAGERLEKLVSENPNVSAVSPFVSFTGLIENGSQLKIAQVRGVDPKKQDQVSQLSHYIPAEQWQAFHQEGGLILGAGIAKDLSVEAGDEVTLLLPQPTEDGKLAQPLRFSLPVTGILKLEGQLDHSYALLPLTKAQELLEYSPQEISGVELSLKAPFAVNQLALPELNAFEQPLYCDGISDWRSLF